MVADLTSADASGPGGPPVLIDDVVEHPPVVLRADLAETAVEVPPGQTVELPLRILNTSAVIETIHVELLGLMARALVVSPDEISLFPGESADVTVALSFHRTLPAGEHEGLLVVSGGSGQVAPAQVPLRVDVPAVPAATVTVEPPLRTAGRKAEFELLAVNDGNTPLRLHVRAADADRVLALQLESSTLHLRVDESDGVRLVARKRRHWTGPPVEHVITVDVDGDGVERSAEIRFRQKPRLTAGVITLLTLAVIVTLWALAMMFGVQAALAPTPPTKMLPATFLEGVGMRDLDPTVVGGSVAGTITASTTAKPVARATVEAFDQQGRLVAATATDDDGVYVLDGLLPVRHRLRLRAPGFEEQWWPGVDTAGAASTLMVSPTAPAQGINARLVGTSGALGGQVIAGDGDPVPISVEVLALDLLEPVPEATTTTDEQGIWSIAGLPAPASYRITYRADGYAPVEVSQPLGAGDQLVVNTTRLPAAAGSITGLVVDRLGVPVGGVAIAAQRDADTIDFTTPTSGDVGFFTFEELDTPGTYLLTLTAEGYASETIAVRLGPGEAIDQLEVVLGPATGTVSGRALTTGGSPLGGVTVTVSGGGTVLSTETLTSGDVGSFRVTDLPLAGLYAVTFDLVGFARETVQVELDSQSPAAVAEVAMTSSVGAVTGVVLDAVTGASLGAVDIEVSDGAIVRTTTTASVPEAERGTFLVGGLAPGTYTVTARAQDGRTLTILQAVTAGTTHEVTLRVGASS